MEAAASAPAEDPLVAGRDKIFSNFVKTMAVGRYQLPSPPSGVMLEFGVGSVRGYIERYRAHFERAIALDIYDYRSAYPGCEFLLSNGRTIDLPDRSVDFVASHSVVEHVEDIGRSLDEINRVLKIGAWALLTVAPLYYCYDGGHWGSQTQQWEHLDPESKFYTPIGQRALNGLTVPELLSHAGRQPWRIARMERSAYAIQMPDHIKARIPALLAERPICLVDFFTREFRLLVQKTFDLVDGNIQFEN